jgi:hypothetical protein
MKYLLGFIGFIVAVLAILFIPSQQPKAPAPWEIIIKDDGNPEVFDIHIGHSNLAHAQRTFREQAEVAIFEDKTNNKLSAEAYFESINLGGLSAKVVLNLAVTQSAMQTMIGRAQEGRIQSSGARKYQLNPIDSEALLAAPIYALTYIPSFVKLDQSILTSRFGEPYKQETLDSKSIWYYPNKGLTAQFSANEKSLLQYKVINSAQLTFDAENQSGVPSLKVD